MASKGINYESYGMKKADHTSGSARQRSIVVPRLPRNSRSRVSQVSSSVNWTSSLSRAKFRCLKGSVLILPADFGCKHLVVCVGGKSALLRAQPGTETPTFL